MQKEIVFSGVERHYFVPKNMFLLPGNVAQCSGGAGQMLEMLHPRNMEYRPKQIQVNFTPFWCNLKDDLWKSGCCELDSERKKVVTSSNDSLACALIDLGAFGSMGVHLPSEKPILPYFSSLSMVAILVCESHRQAGLSTLGSTDQLLDHTPH